MRKPLQVLSLSLSLPPYRGWAARNHNKAAAVAGPDPVSQPDGGGGSGRHRIGPVSQIAADGADGADGRTDDLSPYLSSSGRKGSEEKPYLPNSISISCPRYSFHAEADTRTSALLILSYPYMQ